MNIINRFTAAKTAFFGSLLYGMVALNTAMAQAAPAAGFDLTSAQATILGYVGATVTFIVAIGLAVLGLVMVAKAIKWARRAG